MSEARPLSGRTLFTAVFGDPVEHSLSPTMHNAAYAALGLERTYVAFHVKPERLRDAMRALPALGLLGVNLTVPHKERAFRMMAHLSDEARTLGAVNCVVNRAGALYGDNTDARGLEADLRQLGVALGDRLAIVIGAGGAAGAAVLACLRLGAHRIVVCNRTVARANRLARRFAGYVAGRGGGRPREIIEARGLDALLKPALLADAALIVNATPMGLKTGGFAPLAYDTASATTVFYDMVYALAPTPFIQSARALGRPAYDGAGMLLEQGELAFELFNGVKPPPGVMRAALYSALSRPLPTRD